MRLRAAVVILALLLTGCAAIPSKVSLPGDLGETNVDVRGQPTSSAKPKAVEQFNDLGPDVGIHPLATTRNTVLYQINLLIGDWNREAGVLYGERDISDNVTFWGTLTAAAFVLDGKIKAAKGVGALVAGNQLVYENYAIAVQASNYVTAAEAAECVRAQVLEVSQDAWTVFLDDNGNPKSSEIDDETQYAALAAVFPRINGALSSIYKRLRINQRAVRVTAPSADSIRKVIDDTQKQVGLVDELAARSFKSDKSFKVLSFTNAKQFQLKQLLAVGAKAQACATAIGG